MASRGNPISLCPLSCGGVNATSDEWRRHATPPILARLSTAGVGTVVFILEGAARVGGGVQKAGVKAEGRLLRMSLHLRLSTHPCVLIGSKLVTAREGNGGCTSDVAATFD